MRFENDYCRQFIVIDRKRTAYHRYNGDSGAVKQSQVYLSRVHVHNRRADVIWTFLRRYIHYGRSGLRFTAHF